MLLEAPAGEEVEAIADKVACCLLDAQPNQLPFLSNLKTLHLKIGRQEFALVVDQCEDGADMTPADVGADVGKADVKGAAPPVIMSRGRQ